MRKVTLIAQFEKDVKRAKKRSYEMNKLSKAIRLLGQGDLEDRKYRHHPLKGKYEGLRECHLSPDWLLIYHSSIEQVLLVRTGTHTDLFR
jgi:mRNA interferase YafQ